VCATFRLFGTRGPQGKWAQGCEVLDRGPRPREGIGPWTQTILPGGWVVTRPELDQGRPSLGSPLSIRNGLRSSGLAELGFQRSRTTGSAFPKPTPRYRQPFAPPTALGPTTTQPAAAARGQGVDRRVEFRLRNGGTEILFVRDHQGADITRLLRYAQRGQVF
jgi:hypothetical protein